MTLIEDVRDWLGRTGYPLEMRVAREFRSYFHHADQSRHYRDVITGHSREADVVAGISASKPGYWAQFIFVIECKSTQTPWVVFTEGRENRVPVEPDFWLESLPASNVTTQTCLTLAADSIGRRIPLLDSAEFVGYGIAAKANLERNQRNEAYDAVRQAMSAAIGIAQEGTDNDDSPFVTFVIPIVVTAGPILECWLTPKGSDVTIETVTRSSVQVSVDAVRGGVAIPIWHESAVPDLAQACYETADAFLLSR